VEQGQQVDEEEDVDGHGEFEFTVLLQKGCLVVTNTAFIRRNKAPAAGEFHK
jgi:hypothetical protein